MRIGPIWRFIPTVATVVLVFYECGLIAVDLLAIESCHRVYRAGTKATGLETVRARSSI